MHEGFALNAARRLAMAWALALALAGIVLGAGATMAPNAAAGQDGPPPPQNKPLLVTGATLHTISGEVIERGQMLMDGGRIVAIAAFGATIADPRAAAAQTVDLSGKHVYPGFVAANTVLGLTEISAVRATVDSTEFGTINPNARALVAVNADSELLPVARANGVLAALAVPRSGAGGLIAGTSALIQLDGWTWEDMAIAPAVALHVVLPSMRLNAELFPAPLDERLADFRRFTAERLRQLDDAFDAAAAYNKARGASPDQQPVDARWEAMRPVMQGQRPVFVDADELSQIRHALGLAQRHGLKLVIVGGADAWRIADVLRERQVPVVIAGVHRLPIRRGDAYDEPFRLAARLAQAGVRFCIARSGSEFDAAHERNLPYEAATAAAFGLPRGEALKAITLYPAQILGVDDRLGSLQTGRLASFIVTDGDPLDIRTRVERAFVQGREIDLSNRQTRLEQKYRTRIERMGK
jgi:imidazolonepropionase-like amidohydrolase